MIDDIINNIEILEKDFIKEFFEKNKDIGPPRINNESYSEYSLDGMIGLSKEEVLSLFEKPKLFHFNEALDCFFEIDKGEGVEPERFYLQSNPKKANFETTIDRVIANLPEVRFDLECGGYPMRQLEAASLYKVIIINKLFNGKYKAEIDKMLQYYDFERWTDKTGSYAFTDFLNNFSEDADPVARIILMCCGKRLIADKLKKDTSYRGILSAEDAEWLRILSEKDARISLMYNSQYKDCTNAKEKYEISEKLKEAKQKLLDDEKVSPDYLVLFSIYNMNQDDVSFIVKDIIKDAAKEYVGKLKLNGTIKGDLEANELMRKLRSRVQRIHLRRMKEIRYKAWKNRSIDTDLSVLAPK